MNPLDSNSKSRTLVVGLGSFHGDDRAGWNVIDRLERLPLPGIELRKAMIPLDILDWIDTHCSLHLIDACACADSPKPPDPITPFRLKLVAPDGDAALQSRLPEYSVPITSLHFRGVFSPDSPEISFERPVELRSAGSHQIDALTVLQLSARFGSLPKHVVIWGIPGTSFAPGEVLSTDCETAVSNCVDQMSLELQLVSASLSLLDAVGESVKS